MSADELREGELVAEKYRVERVLGSGGMGVVVAAIHVELDQRVAIKVLKRDFAESEAIAERFRREARAACKIKSPHGARVLDVGTTLDGLPYMVMEYLQGHDLSAELERRGRFSVEEAASFVLQAGDALCDAHDEAIIHRDLKPANLFLTERGGLHAVKVLDFGISKSLHETGPGDAKLTQTQALVGSPMYMSPEQLDSPRSVDARTDIWSLGIVLYELVTGNPPFLADGIAGLIKQIVAEPPPPLAQFGVDAPPEFEEIILRCLAKNRDDRYASVRELMTALAPFAKDSPLSLQFATGSYPGASAITRRLHPTGDSARTDGGAAERNGVRTQVATSDRNPTQFEQSHTNNPEAPARRGPWPWLVAALAAVATGGSAFFYVGQDLADPGATGPVPASSSDPSAVDPSAVDPSAVDPAAVDRSERPTQPNGAPLKAEPLPDERPSPEGAEPSTDAKPTSDEEAPSVGARPPRVVEVTDPPPTEPPPAPPARPRPRPKPKPAVPEPSPPSGISDFGGRH